MNLDKIQQAYADKERAKVQAKEKAMQEGKHSQSLMGGDAIQKAVLKGHEISIKHREQVALDAEKQMAEAISAINKMNLTMFNASQPKMADMVDNLRSLCSELSSLSDNFKKIGFKPVSDSMAQLIKKIDAMPSQISSMVVRLEKTGEEEKLLKDVIKAISKLELSPQINVASPNVNVPKLDLSPILDVLSKEEKPEIEIEDFMVQDQKTEGLMQYFGLVHPTGAWMIIENNTEDGTYKYAFGKDNYSFDKRVSVSYGSITGINALHS